MKKRRIIKWFLLGIPLLFIAGVGFIVVSSYVEHRNLVEQEKAEYPAPGVLVDVHGDGAKLHVYAKGSRSSEAGRSGEAGGVGSVGSNNRGASSPNGEATLVFLSGFGTSSPVYDFKALYNKLSDDYRIAVVERPGYGWSDITSTPRDIDTLLEETRSALKLAGEQPPYVLFPHSMAGLEAIQWSHRYPHEIEAVIGLDPLVPGYHEQTDDDGPALSRVLTFLARTGLMRSQPDVCRQNFRAIKKGLLTAEEAEIACTIFFRRTFTENMWNEAAALPANVQTVKAVGEQGPPAVPFHAFISGEGEQAWQEAVSSYTRKSGGEYSILDAEHYLHLDKPELIAKESKKLISRHTR